VCTLWCSMQFVDLDLVIMNRFRRMRVALPTAWAMRDVRERIDSDSGMCVGDTPINRTVSVDGRQRERERDLYNCPVVLAAQSTSRQHGSSRTRRLRANSAPLSRGGRRKWPPLEQPLPALLDQ
jgi:hypothetical protein